MADAKDTTPQPVDGWWHLEHEETGGTTRIPADESSLVWHQARGWRVVDPPADSPFVPAADGVAVAVIVSVWLAPAASESIWQVTSCAPAVLSQPALVPRIVRPTGTGSVTTTVLARDGPELCTFSVYVTLSPTAM